MKLLAVVTLTLSVLVACGGGGPSAPTPVSTPAPMIDGRLEAGELTATFTEDTRGCGTINASLPYREVGGGTVTLRDYDFKVYLSGTTTSPWERSRGDFNGTVLPRESRSFTWNPKTCLAVWDVPHVEFTVNYVVASGAANQISAKARVKR